MRIASKLRDSAERRDLSAVVRIPYTVPLDPYVVRTAQGAYVMGSRLEGAGFECADDAELNGWHERLQHLWRTIASPHLALWTHLVREPAKFTGEGGGITSFGDQVHGRYSARLATQQLWSNDLYLSLVYRPISDVASSMASRLFGSPSSAMLALEMSEALDVCSKLRQTVLSALDLYGPEPLGAYTETGRHYSSWLEFLGSLINGESQRMPLPRAGLANVLTTSRLLFAHEYIEYRQPSATRLGAMLAIKEYATPTLPGLFNALLTAPYSVILTQSFTFMTRAKGQGLLLRQLNRLSNAGDHAISQAEELRGALDELSSGGIVMGDHHFSLQILSEPFVSAPRDAIPAVLRRMTEALADARTRLADTGILVAREDLALEAAFWAQLPGHFTMRPRVSPISSRNFAGMSAFHNFPCGLRRRGHWGEAIVTLPTSAQSPYGFALHEGDIGHTFFCGPTGSGKTVLMAFLMALYHRKGVTQVVFDKDRGLEIVVRALGGRYLPLRSGRPTGFNPLALPATPANVEFLRNFLHVLVRGEEADGRSALTARQEQDLDHALRATMTLPYPERRLSRLIEYLDRTDLDGLYGRLSQWCADVGGQYAWVFDQAEDTVVPQLDGIGPFAFDVTEFLDQPLLRTPITLYLFHLVRQLLDGRRLICWLDEFWRLLSDPAFEQFAKDGPKTWRKLNAAMCLATQSASDVLHSPLSQTIIEQTPTKIFFPNLHASQTEYREGFGLTARQFALIRSELSPASRQFLIKKGARSVVCGLDLHDEPGLLAVLSARVSSLHVLEELLAIDTDPTHWLPLLQSRAVADATDATGGTGGTA
jgi:type IV secretion system protein VirB4